MVTIIPEEPVVYIFKVEVTINIEAVGYTRQHCVTSHRTAIFIIALLFIIFW
jgi:hypothetical protein